MFCRHLSRQCATTARMKSSLTVYGHYVSQPSRAVIWLLKINELNFEFKKVEPISGETRTVEYKSKFPTGLIPGIDDDGFYLAEGSAIMQYFCEKHGLDQWWPSGNDIESAKKRAKIAEYLSNFHHSSRLLSHKVMRPFFEEMFANRPEVEGEVVKRQAYAVKNLKRFGEVFLSDGKYINGMEQPTIADLAAYCEVAQLTQVHILPSLEDVPVVDSWTKKMQELPYHDDVHRTIVKLGSMALAKKNGAR